MKYDQAIMEEIGNYNAHQLAARADSYADNHEAAVFFTSIRDNLLELVESYIDPEDFEREIIEDYSGQAHEIADNAPDVYTHQRWQEFVGTQAYTEDTSEFSSPDQSLTDIAGIALYLIAQRLVAALAEEIKDGITDEEPADDE